MRSQEPGVRIQKRAVRRASRDRWGAGQIFVAPNSNLLTPDFCLLTPAFTPRSAAFVASATSGVRR